MMAREPEHLKKLERYPEHGVFHGEDRHLTLKNYSTNAKNQTNKKREPVAPEGLRKAQQCAAVCIVADENLQSIRFPWFSLIDDLHCPQAFNPSVFLHQLHKTINFMAPFLLKSIAMQAFLSQITIKHYYQQVFLLIITLYSASKLPQSHEMKVFYFAYSCCK